MVITHLAGCLLPTSLSSDIRFQSTIVIATVLTAMQAPARVI
jgi:hypothetical protein